MAIATAATSLCSNIQYTFASGLCVMNSVHKYITYETCAVAHCFRVTSD